MMCVEATFYGLPSMAATFRAVAARRLKCFPSIFLHLRDNQQQPGDTVTGQARRGR